MLGIKRHSCGVSRCISGCPTHLPNLDQPVEAEKGNIAPFVSRPQRGEGKDLQWEDGEQVKEESWRPQVVEKNCTSIRDESCKDKREY